MKTQRPYKKMSATEVMALITLVVGLVWILFFKN